jgi:DNA-binding MarR family transcriptional regulator
MVVTVGGKAKAPATESEQPTRDGGCPVLDLTSYVPALLTFVSNKLSRSGSALYRRHFGVGIIEWRILAMLAVEPAIPATRVCQVIGLDKGPVSRSLAFMERRGLVTIRADEADTRRRLATLTPAGRALHDRIIVVALERERRLLSCLTPEQRAALVELLNLLHDNLAAVNRPLPIPPAVPAAAGQAEDHGKDRRGGRRRAGAGR